MVGFRPMVRSIHEDEARQSIIFQVHRLRSPPTWMWPAMWYQDASNGHSVHTLESFCAVDECVIVDHICTSQTHRDRLWSE